MATCPGNGAIYPPQGFWATPPIDESAHIYPEYILACTGAGTSATRCRPDTTKYEKTCSSGYRGRLCAKCESGYFGIGNGCMKCLEGKLGKILMIFASISGFVFFIAISYSRTISESGSAKILVVFIQTLYYMWNEMSVDGSELVSFTTGIFGHMKLPGPSCYISGWTYDVTYSVSLLLPVMIVISIVVVFLVRVMLLKHGKRKRLEWKHRSETAVVFVIYFSYVAFSSEVALPIPCQKDPGLDEKFMRNNPDERCSTRLQYISFILLFTVVLTIPSGLILRYFRKGRPKKETPLYTLSRQYHKEMWMWELVITARRLLLIVIFMIIPSKVAYQSLFVCIVCGGSLVLQVRYTPFRSRLENVLESLSLLIVIINYGVALQIESPKTDPDSTMPYILMSVDLLFALWCAIYIFKSLIITVVNKIKGEGKSIESEEIRTSRLMWVSLTGEEERGGM